MQVNPSQAVNGPHKGASAAAAQAPACAQDPRRVGFARRERSSKIANEHAEGFNSDYRFWRVAGPAGGSAAVEQILRKG
jgi:hypothetical protein